MPHPANLILSLVRWLPQGSVKCLFLASRWLKTKHFCSFKQAFGVWHFVSGGIVSRSMHIGKPLRMVKRKCHCPLLGLPKCANAKRINGAPSRNAVDAIWHALPSKLKHWCLTRKRGVKPAARPPALFSNRRKKAVQQPAPPGQKQLRS